ncbi:MAG: hypothetical protein PF485_10840 [Bacteroidales bacterium]|jgi:hypothetical protein|nr:hypothetical protein [Bacteroidales bacterium]
MKKQSITLFYLLFFVSINVFSQQDLTFSGNGEINFNSGYFTKYVSSVEYKKIDGNPYLFENWSSGLIKLKSGMELKIESCKYDIYEDMLMFLKDEVSLYFSNPEDIDRFTIGTSDFINLKLDKKNDFFEILVEVKDFILLKKYKYDIIKGKESVGIIQATNDKFKISCKYYLKKGNAEIVKVKIKEKDILELMNDKKQEVRNYIIDNKLNLKEENDLVAVFKFYSTLV